MSDPTDSTDAPDATDAPQRAGGADHGAGRRPDHGSDLNVRLGRSARTLITLGVLALIFVVGVGWGWHHLTAPVPGLTKTDAAMSCTDRQIARGDRVEPDTVTVSVLNAGSRNGLAQTTLDALVADGFAEGRQANAPTESSVRTVQIWSTEPRSPAVKLVRSYLGGKSVQIVRSDAGSPGINVLVGDKFKGVQDGAAAVRARRPATICGP